MSGTKSPFQKAPATEDSCCPTRAGQPRVLIVAHGQPSDPQTGEAALQAVRQQVQAVLPGVSLWAATLAAEGWIEAALAECAMGQPPFVYPLFMADGWFVRSALPKRLGTDAGPVMSPLGLDAGLPAVAAQVLAEAGPGPILIAAHGSARSDWAAEAAEAFCRRLRPLLPGRDIGLGFVEQAPFIAEVAAQQGDGVCLPFFALGGAHVSEDIPRMLAEGGFKGQLLPPLGEHKAVAQLIAVALQQQISAGERDDEQD